MEKRNTISGFITAGIWSGLVLFSLLLPVGQKPPEKQFKEIAIQLESAKPAQKPEEKPAEKPAPAPAPAPEPVKKSEPVKQSEPVKKAEPVKQTEKVQPVQKATPAPQPEMAPQKLQKSVEELMAEQNAKKTAKTAETIDWDAMFGDSDTVVASAADIAPKTVSSQNQISGTAAAAAETDTGYTTPVAAQKADVADSGLTGKLASVNKTWTGSVSGSDLTAAVLAETSGSSGSGVSLVLQDGTTRKLLMPSVINPDISAYAHLIEGQPEVTIRFEITPDGLVSYSSITVSAGLPSQVSEAIKQYLSSELWFEQAATTGIATFTYRITRQ
ncbi:MAG: hypothetical protein MJ178_02420 [Treponemataceae bacterium]|nr:hypothetical protein [Treponemataceae bacterium]